MPSHHPRHFLGLAWLLLPGLAAATFALLTDVVRGRSLIDDWGSGQSVLFACGLLLSGMGWLLHRKAVRDEQLGRRRYGRTLAFVFIPFLLVVALPLALAEAVSRGFPDHHDCLGEYRQPDAVLGFALAPNTRYHVLSRPKDYDIRIRVDSHGFRQGPGSPATVSQADVLLVGDSHAFGFGVPEDQTLAACLHRQLSEAGRPSCVLNAGVPGYGLGQMLLRMRTLPSLPAGAVVAVYVNPLNDLVNMSSAVDYHCPKPYPMLADGRLEFGKPPADWCSGPYWFSPPFAQLNEAFLLSDDCRWYHSALLKRIRGGIDRTPVTADGTALLADETPAAKFLELDRQMIFDRPLQSASRMWPEMPRFAESRETLSQLTRAVLEAMQAEANRQNWHLLVVVAKEAYRHQPYWQQRLDQIREANPQFSIETGWSRAMMLEQLQAAGIETVRTDFADAEPSAMYVQNDEHTSGAAFQIIAAAMAERIGDRDWLGNDPTPTDCPPQN